jgi:hypothetical protein
VITFGEILQFGNTHLPTLTFLRAKNNFYLAYIKDYFNKLQTLGDIISWWS